jgi:hypothetical protein
LVKNLSISPTVLRGRTLYVSDEVTKCLALIVLMELIVEVVDLLT